MKKLLAIILACVMCTAVFASCSTENGESETTGTADITETGNEAATSETESGSVETEYEIPEDYEAADMRIFAMNGPTGMGMAKLYSDNEADACANNYEFTLASNADAIKAEIIKGDFDVAAIPTNLAAVLYNKTNGGLYIAAVNTLGVLYIIENGDTVKSISDLNGKKIAATGQGSVPEYALNYILTKNNIDCEVTYYADGAELAGLVTSEDVEIAMLPVPYATKVTMGDSTARIALSVTDEFKAASGIDGDSLCQACIVINPKFAEANPEAVKVFLKEYEASVNFVLNNQEEAAGMMESAGIIPAKALALKAIPSANLTFLTGEEMKTALNTFYSILFEANPASVGGKLPDEKIYG